MTTNSIKLVSKWALNTFSHESQNPQKIRAKSQKFFPLDFSKFSIFHDFSWKRCDAIFLTPFSKILKSNQFLIWDLIWWGNFISPMLKIRFYYKSLIKILKHNQNRHPKQQKPYRTWTPRYSSITYVSFIPSLADTIQLHQVFLL